MRFLYATAVEDRLHLFPEFAGNDGFMRPLVGRAVEIKVAAVNSLHRSLHSVSFGRRPPTGSGRNMVHTEKTIFSGGGAFAVDLYGNRGGNRESGFL